MLRNIPVAYVHLFLKHLLHENLTNGMSACNFFTFLFVFGKHLSHQKLICNLKFFHNFDSVNKIVVLKSAASFCGTTSIKQVVFQ